MAPGSEASTVAASIPRRVRRLALQGLSCLDVRGEGGWELLRQFLADSKEGDIVVNKSLQLLRGAYDDRTACDEIMTRHARHWDLGRLALVDRNILRLAIHELRQAGTPYKVVITEALHLAEEFSSAESPRFINGVLDSVAKEIRAGTEGER